MDEKKSQFPNLITPKIRDMQSHKRRLRVALLLAHGECSRVQMFGSAINSVIENMSKLQRGLAVGAMALAISVIAGGFLGPSASSVAHAEAQETVNRAFARIANLTDEERADLEQRFQERVQFKSEVRGGFMGMLELTPEEMEARHAEMKASLTEALNEARNAFDLQILSADEMPVPGFLGRTGRAFGFRMMEHHEDFEERLANLPEDIQTHLEERATLHEDMQLVSFLVYTNSLGEKVTLGMNNQDEPVIKLIQPEDGSMPAPFMHKGLGPFRGFGDGVN